MHERFGERPGEHRRLRPRLGEPTGFGLGAVAVDQYEAERDDRHERRHEVYGEQAGRGRRLTYAAHSPVIGR